MSSYLYWIEPILMGICLIALIIRRQKSAAIFCGLYLLILVFFRDYSPSAIDYFAAHSLAIPHIITSWAAKALIIGTSLVELTKPEVVRFSAIKCCILLQSLTIILGMFWAFDAPDWGALWQWDGIETLSLCTLTSLLILEHSAPKQTLPAIVTLFTLIVQNLALYGFGMTDDISRHSYNQIPQSHLFWIIGQCLFFAVVTAFSLFLRKHKKSTDKETHFEENKPDKTTSIRFCGLMTSCFTCAGISVIICTGIRLEESLLWIVFSILWVLITLNTSVRSWVHTILGLIFIVMLANLPTKTDLTVARLEMNPQTSLQLVGIEAKSDQEILHYTSEIALNNHIFALHFIADKDGIHPDGHMDVRNCFRMERFWAVDYKASQGITLLRRDITLNKWCELLLILIFFATQSWLIPKKKSKNELKDSEQ